MNARFLFFVFVLFLKRGVTPPYLCFRKLPGSLVEEGGVGGDRRQGDRVGGCCKSPDEGLLRPELTWW